MIVPARFLNENGPDIEGTIDADTFKLNGEYIIFYPNHGPSFVALHEDVDIIHPEEETEIETYPWPGNPIGWEDMNSGGY